MVFVLLWYSLDECAAANISSWIVATISAMAVLSNDIWQLHDIEWVIFLWLVRPGDVGASARVSSSPSLLVGAISIEVQFWYFVSTCHL